MDGFGAITLLYGEEFGSAFAVPAETEQADTAITGVDVENAVRDAVASAREAWAHTAEAQRTAALQALVEGLEFAQEAARQKAESTALALAQAALGLVASAFPELCSSHGDAEVRALLAHLLPQLARPMRPVVRVHAGLIEALRDDLAAYDEALLDHVEFRPADLPAGDVRLSWENGGLIRDGDGIRDAMLSGLAELGLLPPSNEATQDVCDAK